MVLTIGDDDDGLAHAFLLGKAMAGHADSRSNIRTLRGYHRGRDAGQEHLRAHIVAGDGQLHKGVSGKDNQTYLIVIELVYQILDEHLGAVQTTGCHILGKHGIADVHTDDGLDASTLLVADFGSHLRTCQHHDEQCQGTQQQRELHQWTEPRHVRHQLAHQFGVAKTAQALLLLAYHQPAKQRQ